MKGRQEEIINDTMKKHDFFLAKEFHRKEQYNANATNTAF